jgi:hypothetical protein
LSSAARLALGKEGSLPSASARHSAKNIYIFVAEFFYGPLCHYFKHYFKVWENFAFFAIFN